MQKDTLRNLLFASAIFIAVMWIGPQLVPPNPQPSGPATQPLPATGSDLTTSSTMLPGDRSDVVSPSGGSAAVGTPYSVRESEQEQTYSLGAEPSNGIETVSGESPYRTSLVLSNIGASIAAATLTDHAEGIGAPERYKLLDTVEDPAGRKWRSLTVESVTIDNVVIALADKKWHSNGSQSTDDRPGQRIQFTLDIDDSAGTVIRLVRSYTIYESSIESGRHDLGAGLSVVNLSSTPRTVIVAYRGGVGVRPLSSMQWASQFVDWGLFRDGFVEGNRKNADAIAGQTGHRVPLYAPDTGDSGAHLSWAATGNTYFTCTVAPLNADGTDNAAYLAGVEAVDVDGVPQSMDDVTLQFVTKRRELEAGQEARFPADVFLGEKDAGAFKSIEPYRLRNYYYQLSQSYGSCTFTWLVELMIWLLNGFHAIVRDFGVAIIILVLIVRTLLHPITKKGQVNMVKMQKKMQELAPKIEEIKKKYANDKARLNQEMMKLNINPAGQILTCLPMMLQMPIWVALYISLSNNVLIRHAGSFVVPWVDDLAAQDALITFSSPIIVPLLGWSIPSFNLLPILVAVFMYTQQKLQPKPEPSPNMTDQQRQQQEMMKKMGPMMSIMMLFIFYKMPAGLNLYIMASSLFGTIEQKRIRTHIKEQEAAGTLHKSDAAPATPKKKGKPSFMERMQKAVDDAQKMQTQKQPKPKRRN